MNGKSWDSWISKSSDLPPLGLHFVALDSLSQAWTLSALQEKTKQPILVVFRTHSEARNAIDNLDFLGGRVISEKTHYLPPLDFDFYRGLLPNPETLCERNTSLFHALNDPAKRIFITTLDALLQKNVTPEAFLKATLSLEKEQEVDRDHLVQSLLEAGYQRQPAVSDPGIFSVRGGTVDIFSPLYPKPARLEFFGDFIEEIRFFDPQTQLSQQAADNFQCIPVGLSLVPQGLDFEKAALKIKDRMDSLEVPKQKRDDVLETLSNGVLPSDYSFLFPLLSDGSSSIVDYFPADTLFVWQGKKALLEAAKEREIPKLLNHAKLFEENHLPIASVESLFLNEDALSTLLEQKISYSFEDFSHHHGEEEIVGQSSKIDFSNERSGMKSKTQLALLESISSRFRNWIDEGYRVHVVCHTKNHADRISLLFEPYGIHTKLQDEGLVPVKQFGQTDFQLLNLWVGFITESQAYPDSKLIILSEDEIFGAKKRSSKQSIARKVSPEKLLAGFRDIKSGDFIVHREFGIGRYLGLKSMDFLGVPNDYVLLEYRDGDKLYIPIYRLNILQKYQGGEGAEVALDKLGTEQWTKAKAKAEKAIAELAAELLNIQARRKLIPVNPFSSESNEYHQFEMEFPFDETPDQLKTIEEVNSDLTKAHPMDRLLCGDVGYGKTEVAMRAAARAIFSGKQVAVLVPTTVLAFQHFENFKNRFRHTGARIEMISRLRTPKQTKEALSGLAEGKIDIIIGTHRLLSADVLFKDLGLIVIDEEHRFGVSHKEKLKRMSESVHLLTMTATPIPRTLNMAMTGIKDISIITTPPPDRLSVRTFVCRRSEEIIRDAISNELARDGQIFFLHNRIETIYKVGQELKQIFPKLTFEVVHGQMDGDELEKKMLSFYRGEFHLLLTTAIIESGLDIPKANTIIIDKSQTLGLAQLYQLRGRVGRSDKRAYCYLLVDNENQMTEDAKQRLQVIQRYTELGSGFHIASHDMDIRGSGNLLGKEQSGHLTTIGIDLYMELLEEAVRELRGQEKRLQIEPEITLKIAAYFPESYLPDIGERILLYRRLSSIESEEALSEIESEIRDRLGTPPKEVVNLLGLMLLKLHLKRLHVLKMSCGPKRTSLQFAPSTPASAEKLVKLIQSQPKNYSLTPDQKLVFSVEDSSLDYQLREVQKLSALLAD
ncbi:MAG: transcription-repair coupling factor [Pseudomonadota bacterium]